ncbi:MAG: hypothetical protein KDA89_19705, partial [Planctomycetaceae bacterium]|nr:hypothetical protein [Planctomycetaceae bacterium]
MRELLQRLSGAMFRMKASQAAGRRRPLAGRPAVAAETLELRRMLDATGLQVFHRTGQTFITWNEATNVGGEHYNVYRHTSPINTSNLSQAQRLTS